MTSKLVVNTIEADTGISSVSFASSISMNSTAKFHFSAAGVDIGADTNINRPAAGVLGFNISGVEKVRIDTNGHLNTSGIVTAANFKSGVTNVHNLGVTLTGGQLDVGSNIKIGTAGVVTATSFSGSGANLTSLPAQATIANNADNRIITGGSGVNLNGEANLLFDGSKLLLGATSSAAGSLVVKDNSGNQIWMVGRSSDNTSSLSFRNNADNAYVARIQSDSNAGMQFEIGGSEKIRIDTNGRLLVNTTSASISSAELFEVKSTGNGFSHFRNNHSGYAPIYIDNEYTNTAMAPLITITDGGGNRAGLLLDPNSVFDITGQGAVSFSTGGTVGNATERSRINSSGELWVGTTSGVSNSGYGGFSLNGSSGSLLSLMQNGTEYLRLFGDSNPAIQFAGVLRLFSGVSGGSAIWGISPNGTATGANSVTFNLKSTIQHTTGVMAVSSSYNSGDLYIRIDNIYNLAGNAWWTFGLWIMSNQTVGTLSGHHSAMVHVYITGLGSWSSITATNIQGSMAGNVSNDQHGTNFVELKLDAHDSSRGPCTVLCNGGTFDPPRISFH